MICCKPPARLLHTFGLKVGHFKKFQVAHFLHTKFAYFSDFDAYHCKIMEPTMFSLYFILISVNEYWQNT